MTVLEQDRTTEITLPQLADRINGEHRQAEDQARAAWTHAVNAGELLLQAKAKVQHGGWSDWIDKNCHFSVRTAQSYMQIYRRSLTFDEAKTKRVSLLSFREIVKTVQTDDVPELHDALFIRPPERIDLEELVASYERGEMTEKQFRWKVWDWEDQVRRDCEMTLSKVVPGIAEALREQEDSRTRMNREIEETLEKMNDMLPRDRDRNFQNLVAQARIYREYDIGSRLLPPDDWPEYKPATPCMMRLISYAKSPDPECRVLLNVWITPDKEFDDSYYVAVASRNGEEHWASRGTLFPFNGALLPYWVNELKPDDFTLENKVSDTYFIHAGADYPEFLFESKEDWHQYLKDHPEILNDILQIDEGAA